MPQLYYPTVPISQRIENNGIPVRLIGTSIHELRWRVQDSRVKIGRGTYGAPSIILYSVEDRVEIGNYCSIAGGSFLLAGGEHPTKETTTFPFRYYYGQDPGAMASDPTQIRYADAVYKGAIAIGSDVWIGFGATVLSGVTVGHGAVIGACAVVASNVPPYSIVVGNPARVIRRRFSDDVITELLRVRWWDWHPHRVAQYQSLLQDDPQRFLEAIGNVPSDMLNDYFGPDSSTDQMMYRLDETEKGISSGHRPVKMLRSIARGMTPPYLVRLARRFLAKARPKNSKNSS